MTDAHNDSRTSPEASAIALPASRADSPRSAQHPAANDRVTTIYLVRHGETDWNATGRCQGTEDVPMNDTGRAQVAELARLLTDVTFDAAYTSPLGRTRETAAALLGTRNLEATPVAELVELSYGDLQGTQASAWAPDFRREWEESPWTVTFPNGESLAMVRARAIAALERIVTSHPGQTVLVSSHGHLNRVLALHVFDQSAEDFWAIEQANASVLVLQFPITPQSLETSNDD